MAKSIEQLRTDIRADIRTNGMQQITGDKLGDRMVDVVDTMASLNNDNQEKLSELGTIIGNLGVTNVMPIKVSYTKDGIVLTNNGNGHYHLSGTPLSPRVELTIYGDTKMPNGFVAGKTYILAQEITNPNISLEMFYYNGTSFPNFSISNKTKLEVITIPANASGFIIRIAVTGAVDDDIFMSFTEQMTPAILTGMYKKTLTPEMFGAVADGVTDDTVAFNKMFATESAVYVMNGNYRISSVQMPKRDIRICGNGIVRVYGNGFVFFSPDTHKEIEGITFILEASATNAMSFSGESTDTGKCTLKVSNVSVRTTLMSSKYGINLHSETSALLENINCEGCGIYVSDSVNPMFANVAIMYAMCGIYNVSESSTRGAYTCGLRLVNATILGCTIGIKAVQVDSIIINNCMIDYNDYPVIIIGSEEPVITNSYLSARDGNPALYMARNNSDSGVYGGNGIDTELVNNGFISNCTFIQYNTTGENSCIILKNCHRFFISKINIINCGSKAGIELNNTDTSHIMDVICNTTDTGGSAKCLVSYMGESLGDDSTLLYSNFNTDLPIYVRYAKTDITCSSYKTKVEGSVIFNATTQDRTLTSLIPQGVERCIVGTNDGTKVWYQESGKNLILLTESHASPIRVNYIAYGKVTHDTWQ